VSKIPGVILAGGQARRMGGGDKCLLECGGATLLEHVIGRLEPQVGNMALNANGDRARFAGFGMPVIADTVTGFAGPLAGILAAMDWAAALGAVQVVTVAADTPNFPGDLVAGLKHAQGGAPIVLAASEDVERGIMRHPTFGLWAVDLRDDLRQALGDGVRKIVAWTDQCGAVSAVFDSIGGDPFFNINTPEDLQAAREFLVRL